MKRILIDLPEHQLQALAALVEKEHRPRAALVREAVERYIAQQQETAATDDVFGLWKDRALDGVAYQNELRTEW